MKKQAKYIKHLKKLIEVINMMKNSRYWSLWLIGFLFAMSAFINAIKWW